MRRADLPAAVFIAFAFSACAPATLYTPSGVLVPMFTKGGQAHFSAQGGPQGAQLNIAYTIANHLMLRIQGHTQNRDDGHYHLISAGGGWFLAFGPKRPDLFQGVRLSGSADFGFSDVRGASTSTGSADVKRFYNGTLYRISLQADAGVDFKYAELAIVGRLIYLTVKHGQDSDAGSGATADWWVLEPAAVLRVGMEKLKLEVQAGYSDPYSQTGFIGDYRRWWGMIGLVWRME